MTVPYVYTNLVDGPIGSGGSAYAAATWNGRYQTLYDGVNAHVTNATVGSATAQNHLFAHILSAGNMPLTSAPLRNPGEANYAIDMILLALANITGTVTGSNFSTITYPTTLAATNTAFTNIISGSQIVGAAAAVKGPTAGRLLVGNGASAMTELAPGTSGNIVQSNGTTWTAAAFSASTAIADGTLPIAKFNNGQVTGASTLVLTVGADTLYDANGQLVTYAGGTFTYSGSSTPPVTVAAQYRTDLLYLTPAGAIAVAPGTVAANLSAARAAAPSVYSIVGFPKAFIDLGPSCTNINATNAPSAGLGLIRDARILGPIPLAGSSVTASTLVNASSNAAIVADANGKITISPTGDAAHNLTTSPSDVYLTGSARYRMDGGSYTPKNNQTDFHLIQSGGSAAGVYPNYQGTRKALMSFNLSNTSDIASSAIRIDYVQTSNPSGIGVGVDRSAIVAQGFTQPDNGADTSVIFAMNTGGGGAATFYKRTGYRPVGYIDYAMSPQGAIEVGTDGASQAILAQSGISPLGANAQTTIGTGTSGASAVLTTDTALVLADGTKVPGPTGPVNDPGGYLTATVYPSPMYLRIGTDSVWEIVSYTAVNAGTGALSGVVRNIASSSGVAQAWAANSPVLPVWIGAAVYGRTDNGISDAFLASPTDNRFDNFRNAYAVGAKQSGAQPALQRFAVKMSGQVQTFAPGPTSRAAPISNYDGSIVLRDTTLGVNNGLFLAFGAGTAANHYAAIKGALQDASNSTSGHLVFSTRNGSAGPMTERMAVRETTVTIGDLATYGAALAGVVAILRAIVTPAYAASITTGTVSTVTGLTVTGAAVGDYVKVHCAALVTAGVQMYGVVTATNTVAVTVRNDSGGTLAFGSQVTQIEIWKYA